MVGARIGGAPVHSQKVGPGGVRPSHDAHQGIGIFIFHRLAEAGDAIAELVQRLQQGRLVFTKDVVPHHRIGAGNAGEVAKTAGSITEDLGGISLPGQRIHQRERQQMWQMAGFCQDLVVVIRRHL